MHCLTEVNALTRFLSAAILIALLMEEGMKESYCSDAEIFHLISYLIATCIQLSCRNPDRALATKKLSEATPQKYIS